MRNFYVSRPRFIIEIARILEEHPGIVKIMDDNNYMVVPLERYTDFCHDIGVLLGKAMANVVELRENE